MPKLKLDAALRKEYDAVADILYTKGLVVDANPFVVKINRSKYVRCDLVWEKLNK